MAGIQHLPKPDDVGPQRPRPLAVANKGTIPAWRHVMHLYADEREANGKLERTLALRYFYACEW